jgi:hypothetical protein
MIKTVGGKETSVFPNDLFFTYVCCNSKEKVKYANGETDYRLN